MKLPLDYFLSKDVLTIAKELLGKMLFTSICGDICGGMIVETEAYRAPEDRASHAYKNRKTARNAVMFERGGIAYIYLCYGIHNLFNIVVGDRGVAHAVLIRAIEPLIGVDVMLRRRKKEKMTRALCGGPGALCQALSITRDLNGEKIEGPLIWITDYRQIDSILSTPRVGVEYAGEDALLPWRFRVNNNPWTSPAK